MSWTKVCSSPSYRNNMRLFSRYAKCRLLDTDGMIWSWHMAVPISLVKLKTFNHMKSEIFRRSNALFLTSSSTSRPSHYQSYQYHYIYHNIINNHNASKIPSSSFFSQQRLLHSNNAYRRNNGNTNSTNKYSNTNTSSSTSSRSFTGAGLAMSTAGLVMFVIGNVMSCVRQNDYTEESSQLLNLHAKCSTNSNSNNDTKFVTKPDLRSQYNFIADVVQKVSPAVVHIKTSSHFRQGAGSGFIITSNGFIVTNEHVVRSARKGRVEVELVDGRRYVGSVQVVDPSSDLALIKIDEVNLPTIKLGSSSSVRPGEWVVAVGSPLTLSNTVTSGIVSSVARKSSELGIRNEIEYIQTDAPITFGNSGGPLINLDGEAVGVNAMKAAEGISFAIPSDYVNKFLEKAKSAKGRSEKRSPQVSLGISALTLTPRIAAQLRNRSDIGDLNIDHGVFIVRTVPGSSAQVSGLQTYDVIVKVNGIDIQSIDDLNKILKSNGISTVLVYRAGTFEEIKLQITS